jgi:hypothetical protein
MPEAEFQAMQQGAGARTGNSASPAQNQHTGSQSAIEVRLLTP